MSLVSILGIAVVSSVISGIVKQINKDVAMYVSACSALVLMYFAFKYFQPFIALLTETGNAFGVYGYAKTIMKLTAIGAVTSVTTDICTDMGENSVAMRVELVGKGASCMVVLPVLENLISSVRDFLM